MIKPFNFYLLVNLSKNKQTECFYFDKSIKMGLSYGIPNREVPEILSTRVTHQNTLRLIKLGPGKLKDTDISYVLFF